jgi:hypothetical protein
MLRRPHGPISDRDGAKRGQALVEMSLLLMLLLSIVLGTAEFGFAMDHHVTIEYATREGARVGSALANGGGQLGCAPGQSPNASGVDPQIIAAVQRVLVGRGAALELPNIQQIRIYKADVSGNEQAGAANVWVYAAGAGPIVDGRALDFRNIVNGWPVCQRRNDGINGDSIGVFVSYNYRLRTPFSVLMGWVSIPMSDRTVMNLNPTDE